MPPYQATIQTYATSANLGPLFDRAGAKLDGLFMATTGQLVTTPGLSITSDGLYPVPTDETNIAHKVAGRMFQDLGIKDGLALTILNDLKPGGLGTSGAGAVAVVELINRLYQLNLTTEQKLDYALEGEPGRHPDNVVPCMIGGVVLIHSEGGQKPVYERLGSVSDITPAIVIPLDIYKSGGTAQARKVLEDLTLSEEEQDYKLESANLMISGLRTGNFEEISEAIRRDNSWKKSVTYVRNLPTKENPFGVYGIDVNYLNSGLEAIVGKGAILTPSGAGPAMLIIARDPEVAQVAARVVPEIYHASGKRAEGKFISFRDIDSQKDFVE